MTMIKFKYVGGMTFNVVALHLAAVVAAAARVRDSACVTSASRRGRGSSAYFTKISAVYGVINKE